MKLYYYSLQANFGDALNTWLWKRLLPDRWDPADGVRFSGIGTLIHWVMPRARRWIVFTSGAGYGPPPRHFGGAEWNIVAVRGPLTARVLGLPPSAAASDGALLLATLEEFAPLPADRRSGVIFVPHHDSETDGAWVEACRRAGIEFVSPQSDSRTMVETIRGAKLVLADAMHAAIVADTLRVPWVPLASSPRINTFKWLDWAISMELPYAPHKLPSISLKAVVRRALLPLVDEQYLFEPENEATALANFAAQSRSALQWGRRRRRRVGFGVMAATDRLLDRRFSRRLAMRSDERRLDAVAKALERAAGATCFLSSERVFKARLAVLAERLDMVRRMIPAG